MPSFLCLLPISLYNFAVLHSENLLFYRLQEPLWGLSNYSDTGIAHCAITWTQLQWKPCHHVAVKKDLPLHKSNNLKLALFLAITKLTGFHSRDISNNVNLTWWLAIKQKRFILDKSVSVILTSAPRKRSIFDANISDWNYTFKLHESTTVSLIITSTARFLTNIFTYNNQIQNGFNTLTY